MTREEINAMKPGYEMDVYVHEMVMNQGDLFAAIPNKHPKYSTDIAAAWEVVEKMKPLLFGMREWPHNDGYHFYETWFMNVETGQCFTVRIQSAPEAICKAALIACMEMREKE